MLSALADPGVLLSMIVFLPMAAAIVLFFFPKNQDDTVKQFSVFTASIVLLLTIWIAIPARGNLGFGFSLDKSDMQFTVLSASVPTLNVNYSLGLDGISMPLVVLTSLVCMLALRASVAIQKHVRAYCMLVLVAETGMLGVLMSLDLFLFFLFWLVMILPACFLIGVWGGPRRKFAAIKFSVAMLAGSLLMLIAISMIYRASDLNLLDLRTGAVSGLAPVHTFDIPALTTMGRFPRSPLDQASIGPWSFALFFIAMAIPMAVVPLHGWLPDALADAPTPVAMLLTGVLMRMGGYGLFRICYPMFPTVASNFAWAVCGIGFLTLFYGAGSALACKDFSRLVACFAISQMGFVLVGLGAWNTVAVNAHITDSWKMGVNGAMFHLIANGITSAGMIYLVGVIQDRTEHRDVERFGGLLHRMPVYGGISLVIFLAALGVPGLCGFVGELLVVLSTWNFNRFLAILTAAGAILIAAVILRTVRRVYFGSGRANLSPSLTPMGRREIAIAVPLVAVAVLLGVYPRFLLKYTRPTIDAMVDDWADSRRSPAPPAALGPLPEPRDPATVKRSVADSIRREEAPDDTGKSNTP